MDVLYVFNTVYILNSIFFYQLYILAAKYFLVIHPGVKLFSFARFRLNFNPNKNITYTP